MKERRRDPQDAVAFKSFPNKLSVKGSDCASCDSGCGCDCGGSGDVGDDCASCGGGNSCANSCARSAKKK